MTPIIVSPEQKFFLCYGSKIKAMVRKILLGCGILASLLYIAMNIFIPPLYPGYNSVTQVVSELSAIGAPTRELWVVLGTTYTLLVAAFGFGIIQTAGKNRSLRKLGILMLASGIIGLAWSPMHQREVVAAGGGTFTDTWHIVMSMITLLFMMLMMGYGMVALGKRFRIYSIISVALFIVFGILVGLEAPAVSTNQSTPMIGIWERLNIAVFMIYLFVLATVLLRAKKSTRLVNVINQRLRKKESQRNYKMKQTI
jgi:hypothetical protein